MFCPKCGTQIEANTKFCTKCGTKADYDEKTNNVKILSVSSGRTITSIQFQLDVNVVINIVIAVAMVLAMLILPMFKLSYDPRDKTSFYTISLLGDNYMAGHGVKADITTFSRIAFIVMFVSIIALIIFKLMKKTRFALVSSAINLGILAAYNLYVANAWERAANAYKEYAANVDAGNGLCIICAVALFVLSLREFIKEKKNA